MILEKIEMKKWWKNILFVLIFGLAVSCDNDPVQKGDEAFKKDQLLDAQRYYEKALEESPKDDQLREKLMITFFRTGESFYQTRKLVSAYEGQVKQGFAYLPETLSDSVKKVIATTLLKLAQAFREAPSEDEYSRKELEDKATYYLKTAIEYDSTNTAIYEALDSIKGDEVTNLIKKGQAYHEAGEKKSENYFIADYYFLKALELEPDNKEAAKNLAQNRRKALTIYNYEQFTPIKILKRSMIGQLLVFEIKILNNSNRVMDLKGDGFSLVATDGSRLDGFFSEVFEMPYLTKKLSSGQEAAGVVSFQPTGKRYVRLEYNGGGKLTGSKSLP